MEIGLNDLLTTGHKTKIHNNEYYSTETYVMPFIEKLNKFTDLFVCQAIPLSQVSINPDGSENTIYNKVHVEAVLPGENPEINEVIGFTYALDTRKPLVRFYKAWKRADCGCLLLNNSNFIITNELEPERAINYSPINQLLEKELPFDWIEQLQKVSWKATNDQVNYRLGQWLRFTINFFDNSDFGKVKIATNDIINGYKSIFEDLKSPFFNSLGTDCLNYQLFSAFSNILYQNSKDPANLIIKTRLLCNILSL